MSKLYDAIKKLETKKQEENRDNIPFTRPKKSGNVKRVVALGILAFLLFAFGFFIVLKFGGDRNARKKTYVASVKQVVMDSNQGEKGKVSYTTKVTETKKPIVKRREEHEIAAVAKAKKPIVATRKETRLDKSKTNAQLKSNPIGLANRKPSIVTSTNKSFSQKSRQTESVGMLLDIAENGSDREAVLAYKRLIKLFPDNVDLYNNLAVRYMNLGEYKEAENILLKALSIKDSSTLKLNYTLVLFKLGQLEKARKELRYINANEIKDKKLYYALVSTLFSSKP